MEERHVYAFPVDEGATLERVVELCAGTAIGFPLGICSVEGCDITDLMQLRAMSSDIRFGDDDAAFIPVKLRALVEAALATNASGRSLLWTDYEIISFVAPSAQVEFDAAFFKVVGALAVSSVMAQSTEPPTKGG